MPYMTDYARRILLLVVLAVAGGTLGGLGTTAVTGCTTNQQVDALTVATEVDALNQAWDRADTVIQQNADQLDEADREQLLAGWEKLSEVKAVLDDAAAEDLVRYPMEVERLYWEARTAYSQIRAAVQPYVSELSAQDRVFVQRVDSSAQNLDEAAQRLMENAEGEEAQAVLEMVRLATATAKLAGRIML